MAATTYRIKDLALRLDRTVLTVKRWEERGWIPAPRKDTRGWRVYSEEEVEEILRLARETNYFRNQNSTK